MDPRSLSINIEQSKYGKKFAVYIIFQRKCLRTDYEHDSTETTSTGQPVVERQGDIAFKGVAFLSMLWKFWTPNYLS